jgi:hypothetical protein
MTRPDAGMGAGLILLALLAIVIVAPCVVATLIWLHKQLHVLAP